MKMNNTKEFISKPYSSFNQKEKNKIINNNYQSIFKYVLEKCDDYRLLTKSIETLKKKYAFDADFIFYENIKNYAVDGTVIENFYLTLETLIILEKENKEISDMLVKSRDIYNSVLKATNNEVSFEIIRFGNIHTIANNTLSYSIISFPLHVLKDNIQYIKEKSDNPDTKKNADKLKLSLLYEDRHLSDQDYKKLMMDFVYEKKTELNEFISYVTEKMYVIEKMVQDKLNYIGSKKHLMNYMEQNDKLLFNQKCELIQK
jgi:hypothetical protein